MAKRKAKKPTLYETEVKRIKRQLKALEKRGYITEKIAIPKTLQGARNLTLEKIYKKAKYVVAETGEVISGLRGQEYERSERSKRSAETRRFRKRLAEQLESDPDYYDRGIDELQERLDKEREKEQSKDDYAPSLADIVIDNLIMLIERLENADVSWAYTRSANLRTRKPEEQTVSEECRVKLLQIINDQIREYGMTEVARRLDERANAGEIQELIDKMLHGYLEDIRPSYTKLASFITVGRLSEEETKYWSEVDNALDDEYGEE